TSYFGVLSTSTIGADNRQPIEAIETPHALPIHVPAFAAQQHPDPEKAEPRPRVGQLPDPQPERGLIPRAAAPIPRGATELRQSTRPRAANLERLLKPPGKLPTAHGRRRFFARPPLACACRA